MESMKINMEILDNTVTVVFGAVSGFFIGELGRRGQLDLKINLCLVALFLAIIAMRMIFYYRLSIVTGVLEKLFSGPPSISPEIQKGN